MKIETLRLMDGAAKAEGTAVIVDVLRASATCACLLEGGAEEVMLVGSEEEAFELRKKSKGYLLVGEREGKKIPGFDYGNSPSDVIRAKIKGKKIAYRSSSGVCGILAAEKATEVLLAGFVNAEATVEYLKKKKPKKISLVAMGWSGRKKALEDELCVQYLQELLNGKKADYQKIRGQIMSSESAEKFLEGKKDFPKEDLDFSLELNRFFFPITAKNKKDKTVMLKAH